MRKILLLAVLALVLVAMPAFASVQNVKVSGEIDSTYVLRNQFDLGASDTTYEQSFFMTQTFLRVDADLTDKVSATVRLINERAWGQKVADETSDTDVDLNLAYVTIKEMLYSPLTVVIGRQALAYGNSLVVDSSGPNRVISEGGLDSVAEDLSRRSAMDGIRAILDYDPLTIDLVYAKIDANGLTSAVLDQQDDVDLLGTNASWKLGDENNTVIEGYFWAKIDRTDLETVDPETVKTETIYLPGVHASANVLDGLMLSAEYAMQFGTDSTEGADTASKRDARAWQLIANYALPFEQTKEYSPVLTTSLTYLSGEKNPGAPGATNTAWDPFFENQSGRKIYNTLFNYTNSYIASAKGSIVPIEDVTASVEWTGLWLDKQLNLTAGEDTTWASGLLQPDATTETVGIYEDNKALGQEIDLGLSYAYTEDVTIGATLGWFIPGDLFSQGNDKKAQQALVNLDVKF